MNYKEAREYIKSINKYGSVLGLDSIKTLLCYLDNPHRNLKVVHFAGTNGKGSTIAFTESIIMEAGYTVGKYISPAVFDDREIFQINGDNIGKDDYAVFMTEIRQACEKMMHDGLNHPTPFEVETALAFLYFEKKKCDIVLLETGMGGATDATNVMEKVICSVITPISLDHMQFLGSTLLEITTIKAGIIKNGCPVVVAKQETEAMEVIAKISDEKESELSVAGLPFNIRISHDGSVFDYEVEDCSIKNIEIKMMGVYQTYNAVTAIETALILSKSGYEKIGNSIKEGIKKAKIQGRFEIINEQPLVIIDGAHNPGAAIELRDSLQMYFTNKKITFIMGVLADKDYDKVSQILTPLGQSIITVTPQNDRALAADKLIKTVLKYNPNVTSADSVEHAVEWAYKKVAEGKSDMIIAFGSLSYLRQVKEIVASV